MLLMLNTGKGEEQEQSDDSMIAARSAVQRQEAAAYPWMNLHQYELCDDLHTEYDDVLPGPAE